MTASVIMKFINIRIKMAAAINRNVVSGDLQLCIALKTTLDNYNSIINFTLLPDMLRGNNGKEL